MCGGVQCAFIHVSNVLAWRDGSEVATGQESSICSVAKRETKVGKNQPALYGLENGHIKARHGLVGNKNNLPQKSWTRELGAGNVTEINIVYFLNRSTVTAQNISYYIYIFHYI